MSEALKALQGDMIAAMKSGDRTRKDVLAMLIAKVKLIAKNDANRDPTDRDVVQAAEKTIKEVKETRSFAEQRGDDLSTFDNEIAVVQGYLPKALTADELTVVIKDLMASGPEGKAMRGHVMKGLSAAHKGSYDPAAANAILAELGA